MREACDDSCWEVIGSARKPATLLQNSEVITNHEEVNLLARAQEINRGRTGSHRQLNLLEVYAYPNSRLTEVAQKNGLHARRITREDFDLGTYEGKAQLLALILRERPEHIWMSPECGPWSSWNRFNAQRSLQACQHENAEQQLAIPSEIMCPCLQAATMDVESFSHGESSYFECMGSKGDVANHAIDSASCSRSVHVRPSSPGECRSNDEENSCHDNIPRNVESVRST